jgi:hypothetical protein
MKRISILGLIAIVLVVIAYGCSYTKSLTQGTTKSPDKELYNQVPTSMRAEIKEAVFDLKEAKANLGNLREKLKLSELVEERAQVFTKMRKNELTVAEYLQKEAEIELDVRKWEAIDKAGLGDREQIVKTIGDLKSSKLSNEAERVKIQAAITNAKLKIQRLDKQIAAQRSKIK